MAAACRAAGAAAAGSVWRRCTPRGWSGRTPASRALGARAAVEGGGELAPRAARDSAAMRAAIGQLLEQQEVLFLRSASGRLRRPDQHIRFTADHLAFLATEKCFPTEVLRKVVGIDPRLRNLGGVTGQSPWALQRNLTFLQSEVGLRLEDLHASVARYPMLLIHSVDHMRDTIRFLRFIVCLNQLQVVPTARLRARAHTHDGAHALARAHTGLPAHAGTSCARRYALPKHAQRQTDRRANSTDRSPKPDTRNPKP